MDLISILTRFRKIDYFPPQQESWKGLRSICIGTKSRNLGDALVLTPLPQKLQERFPNLRITTYPRGFNRIVFENNPYIRGVSHLPKALYGDDANWSAGHLIQQKEAFFGLPASAIPRPKLYLGDDELQWRNELMRRQSKNTLPLVVIHPWGTTRSSVANAEFWTSIVKHWSHRFRFWQVGVEGQVAIPGCEYHFLSERKLSEARKLFAILSGAKAFIGVDSGPMHAARAFDLPSLILVDHLEPAQLQSVFERQAQTPYFLDQNWKYAFLYPQNAHLSTSLKNQSLQVVEQKVDDFFQNLGAQFSEPR